MQIEDAELVRMVGRAYLLGVAVSAGLLWLWLLAGTIIISRGYQQGRTRSAMNLVTSGYALLGYIGYSFVLTPVTLRFMKSVAIVQSLGFHASWVQIGIPSVSIIVWFLVLNRARRKWTPVATEAT
jgi:hypothetical protein